MEVVWLYIHDIAANPWNLELVFSENAASPLGYEVAQQAGLATSQNYPDYHWKLVSAPRDRFILRG